MRCVSLLRVSLENLILLIHKNVLPLQEGASRKVRRQRTELRICFLTVLAKGLVLLARATISS